MDVYQAYVTTNLVILGFGVVVQAHTEDKRLLLDNEPGVDLGGELRRLQTQLLDQQKIINEILNTTSTLQTELKVTETALKQQKEEAMQKELEMQYNISKLQKENEHNISNIRQENERLKALVNGSGSVYIRWGRKTCPSTTSLVYTGFTAGKHFNEKGSGSDNLCLPSDPTWSKYVDGGPTNYRAFIYGAEIDTVDSEHIFNYPVDSQDLPCAVCRSTKTTTVMVPARNNCYAGWTMEYNGYLMTAYHDHYSIDHMCVDGDPEFLNHGGGVDLQHVLYLVEGRCGSLQCPPYVEGRELACVVCSKLLCS